MALLTKSYTLNISVESNGSKIENANIISFDTFDTLVIDKTTDSNGEITSTEITCSTYIMPAATETSFNPYEIRVLIYGYFIFTLSKSIITKSSETFYISQNPFISESTPALVAAYTGITVNSSDITLTEAHTLDEIYDYLQYYAITNPVASIAELINTIDGINFTFALDFIVDNCLITGTDEKINNVILQNNGMISGINVNENLYLNYFSNLSDIDISGKLVLNTAGTYTINDCSIHEIENTSGGSIVINLSGGSIITINSGPDITINSSTVLEFTGLKIGSEVRLRQGSYTLDHTQSVSTTSYQFSYGSDLIGRTVKISIGIEGYERLEMEYTLTSSDTTIPIDQQISESYI